MLHWNSWWSGSTPDVDRPIDEPAPWAPGGLLFAQARFWEQVLAAQRNWWALMASSLPSLPMPPAGVVVPPEPEEQVEEPIVLPAPPSRTPAKVAARRVRPAASGAARTKLKRLNDRV